MVKRKRVISTPKTKAEDILNGMTVDISGGSNAEIGSKTGGVEEIPTNPHETRSKLQSQRNEIISTKDVEIDDNSAPATLNATEIPTVRTSQRTIKRPKRSPSPFPTAQAKKQAKEVSATPETKTRRPWELWSVEDKNTFFEALYEFGKDFEAIQNHIAQKQRKKGITPHLIKNKDQVRHFYYRTWHKISKYLDLGDDIKKPTQELYGLINYGKLRKKIGGRIDEKNVQKLNELIHKGVTLVRWKGKNLRVKTPICRALKKLNQLEEVKDEELIKLPNDIVLEFRPATNKAWSHVQSLSQNPRLRIKLSMQRRLKTVIEFLQKKWQPHRLKLLQQLQPDIEEPVPKLHVQPISLAKFTPHTLKTSQAIAVSNICLETHRETVNGFIISKVSPITSANKQVAKEKSIKDSEEKIIRQVSLDDNLNGTNLCDSMRSTIVSDITIDSDKPPTDVLDSSASFVSLTGFHLASNASSQSKCNDELTKEDCLTAEKIKSGWTAEECGGLLIGELYLMLGNPDKIILQYDWELDTQMQAEHQLFKVLSTLATLASSEFSDLNKIKQNNLSSACHCGLSSLSGTPPSNKVGKNPANTRSPAAIRNNVRQQNSMTPKNINKGGLVATIPTSPSTMLDQAIFAIPSMVPPQNRSPIKVNPSSDRSFIAQLDTFNKSEPFLPRHRKIRRKPLVVQRTLLPKANAPARHMMSLAIVPTSSQLAGTGSFMPVSSQQTLTSLSSSASSLPIKRIIPTSVSNSVPALVTTQSPANLSCQLPIVSTSLPVTSNQTPSLSSNNSSLLHSIMSPLQVSTNIDTIKETSATLCSAGNNSLTTALPELTIPETSHVSISTSPPNISSLFEISLSGSDGLHTSGISESEKLLDLALGNSNSSFAGFGLSTSVSVVKSSSNTNSLLTAASLNTDIRPITPAVSPTASPFKINSPGPETQWLNGESVDFSLSSILGTIESPLKQPSQVVNTSIAPHIVLNESSRDSMKLSSDVDSTLQCMMNENSVDYISKFVDLAAQLSATQETPKKST